jgi:hypothetical protein
MKPETSLTDLDERTLAFLAIVDCDPSEVRDIPLDRTNACHSGLSDPTETSLGNREWHLGKAYRGKKLREIPSSYFWWLIAQPDDVDSGGQRRASRRAKKLARDYLQARGLDDRPNKHEKRQK